MSGHAVLAAGTGRKQAADVIAKVGCAAQVGMDNCPHQTVLVCPPGSDEAVEAELRSRGILCERLPFSRPYHTPQFEPFLPPVTRFYEGQTVRPPRTPIYSCVTGRPFPADPTAIRELATCHWASPVEFVRLVETMYADGVRLFIEAGPRGNLTAFLEDTLRGKPCLAVSANVARRSGLAQINHLVAQLAAHHVPLRLEHLYERREPRRVEWEENGRAEPAAESNFRESALGSSTQPRPRESSPLMEQADQGAHAPRSPVTCDQGAYAPRSSAEGDQGAYAPRLPGARGAVLAQYWGVMEQFLDLQREVMEQFLAGRQARQSSAAPPAPSAWPLLGTVVRHEPGRELVLRRSMDLQEDLFALDHTLGARNASAVDPNQHGLPFLPMAFSLEMMAEAAATLVPGRVVIGMKNVRLQRWVPFDDEPTTIELTARVRPEAPDEVVVSVLDLGNGVVPGSAESPAVFGTVLLGDRHPQPPPTDDFPLSNEGPCRYTAEQLYAGENRLFHGPLFRALCSTDRQGEEGIEGHLVTLPHSGLFRSTPAPVLLTDPLLIDASTHLLGSWHLGQPDQSGRVVLPYELGTVSFYGPRPAEGTRVKCRVRIERSSARQVSHRIDIFGADGQLWCRLHPAEYWRFYWPAEYVEFFRHKERFLLGKPWPAEGKSGQVRCFRVEPPPDLCQPVKRVALAHVTLTAEEWRQFRVLKAADAELTAWLFGRIAAKDAVRALWHDQHGERLFPADIHLDAVGEGRFRARYRVAGKIEGLLAVTVRSEAGAFIAVAAFEGEQT
jgi:malonyl CoA-acyl carrier protein transacylase